ncbi:hypothetical protein [Aureitalea marina]|uniref:hypothetical protein n=1 Tax=Aureitalea marina TaxID=930804 RepID=UPI0015E2F65A|nr:hypothetical protein [Aureitalea marina]
MNLPIEFYEIVIMIVVLGIAMSAVSYWTKGSRNYRSSRNKKARKQHDDFAM